MLPSGMGTSWGRDGLEHSQPQRGIRLAKRQYSSRIADHFTNRRDTWLCPERLCYGARWCPHWHLQLLAEPSCCQRASKLLQWPLAGRTLLHLHKVLQVARHAAHQVHPPPCPGPAYGISAKPLNWWHHLHCPSLSPLPPGDQRHTRVNVVPYAHP